MRKQRPITRCTRAITATLSFVFACAGAAQTPPSRAVPHFPAAAIWNQDISTLTPDPASAAMLIGSVAWGTDAAGSTKFQIDFSMHVLYSSWGNVSSQPLVQESGYFLPDCDTGYPVPLPAIGAIEGSANYTCDYGANDCHLYVVQGDTLFESYLSSVDGAGLHSGCLVKWHLNLVYPPQGRGDGCTSADAAGFPMAPLIFNPDEVYAAMQGGSTLGHALRFIMSNGRIRAGYYVHPASHLGAPTGSASAIPYGARLRLKPGFNVAAYNPAAQVILTTLKKYGMFLSDGGHIPLTADDGLFTTHQWADPDLAIDSSSLFGVSLNDFEVMPIGTPIAISDCVRSNYGDDVIFSDGFNW